MEQAIQERFILDVLARRHDRLTGTADPGTIRARKVAEMGEHHQVLEFVIQDSFTPATLPMARLAEYLGDLATVLGEKEHVHFLELRHGSTAVAHVVDHEAVTRVRERLHAVRIGEADSEARNAHARIQQRLYHDNARAVLRVAGDEEEHLLSFPGAIRDWEQYGPFSEHGQLYGVPISVGGKRQIVNVRLQDGDRIHNCEADRDVALRLAPLLFHHHVRVYGTGRYSRDSEGRWEMRSFRISHFDELDDRPLAETVERLRAVTRKVGLDQDIIMKLASFRHGASGT